ncbi:MAG: DUF1127 domain-containing protein [Alphaproteobacteria bacterium]|nr:DUF1127 domain-containing protein [Alphaproteobacteria bacterium]
MIKTAQALIARIAHWRNNMQGRSRLARLPRAALKDLGLSSTDVWQETKKPFWRD